MKEYKSESIHTFDFIKIKKSDSFYFKEFYILKKYEIALNNSYSLIKSSKTTEERIFFIIFNLIENYISLL